MPALFVKVRVDPAHRGEILEALVADGLGSLRDETGTLRFDVLADQADPDVPYFYEVRPSATM
ncbi:MAG TPA: antibiotic biosynthesis monooxygenase [Chloroflexota bacterium]|jgi:quinol monooxygenase YgiN